VSQATIYDAIKTHNLLQFYYSLGNDPGVRTVEPHMVAYNQAGNLALSAWYLYGNSESDEGPGWREYLLSGISGVTVLPEQFSGPRPHYNPTGGRVFHNIQCALEA
jgi:predicted DNA-binding transcriptional regulator YafY